MKTFSLLKVLMSGLIICCLYLSLPAQSGPLLSKTLRGDIATTEKGFVVNLSGAKKEKTILTVDDVFILDNDLHLILTLPGFSAMEKGGAYRLDLSFTNAERERLLPGLTDLQNQEIPYFTGKENFTVVWRNLVENEFFRPGAFSLNIHLELMGVEADLYTQKPVFSSSSKWITGIAAGAGLAMLGTGFLLSEAANQDYDQYKEMVFLEDPDANEQLSTSNRKKTLSDALLVGGGATLAAGALYFAVKYIPYRKHQTVYDKYNPGVSYEIRPAGGSAGAPFHAGGVQLTIHF